MTRLTACCPNCGHTGAVEERYPWLYDLTGQQRELMLILLERPGQWYSTDRVLSLLYALRSRDEPDTAHKNLSVQVYRIRKRIGNVIESKHSHGYRVRVDKAGQLVKVA